jgi:hypothetical protein
MSQDNKEAKAMAPAAESRKFMGYEENAGQHADNALAPGCQLAQDRRAAAGMARGRQEGILFPLHPNSVLVLNNEFRFYESPSVIQPNEDMKYLLKSNWLLPILMVGISHARLTNAAVVSAPPNAPAVLPGQGLAQHDFFYAGEAKAERMFIVRNGAVVWSYTHSDKGEISDAILSPNGNILFAHQFGVTEINADKKVVWNFDAPRNTEIHTAQPLGSNSVWLIQNGDPAKLVVMNKTTGNAEREFVLPVKNPKSIHGQFRHARLTAAGTVLVAHMDLGKAVEYDLDGKALGVKEVPGIWSATPLRNGNVLAVSNRGFVREISRQGETVWEWTPSDAQGYRMTSLQLATRLPSGNTVINNWFNQWSGQIDPANQPVQAIEVTPDKKIVWALRSWTAPADLGPATTIQILEPYR